MYHVVKVVVLWPALIPSLPVLRDSLSDMSEGTLLTFNHISCLPSTCGPETERVEAGEMPSQ